MVRGIPVVAVFGSVAVAWGCARGAADAPHERSDRADDVRRLPFTPPVARPDLDLRRVSVRSDGFRIVARLVATAPPGSATYRIDFRPRAGEIKSLVGHTRPGGAIAVELLELPLGSSPQRDRVAGSVEGTTVTLTVPRVAVGPYSDWFATARSTSSDPRGLLDSVPDREPRLDADGRPPTG